MKYAQKFPKVSVIVPFLNEEAYLGQSLTALLSQDYPDYEILLIDNGSTDRSIAVIDDILDNFPEKRGFVTVLYEEKKGTNPAREKGRMYAEGEVLAQMDADCIPHSSWIRRGVALLSKDDIVAVGGPYDYADATPFRRFMTLKTQSTFFPLVNRLIRLTGRGAILIGGNILMDAKCLESLGGYNTHLTFYGDDTDLACSMATRGLVHFTSKLPMKTSSRRFKADGFFKVNSRYQVYFWMIILGMKLSHDKSVEFSHPR